MGIGMSGGHMGPFTYRQDTPKPANPCTCITQTTPPWFWLVSPHCPLHGDSPKWQVDILTPARP